MTFTSVTAVQTPIYQNCHLHTYSIQLVSVSWYWHILCRVAEYWTPVSVLIPNTCISIGASQMIIVNFFKKMCHFYWNLQSWIDWASMYWNHIKHVQYAVLFRVLSIWKNLSRPVVYLERTVYFPFSSNYIEPKQASILRRSAQRSHEDQDETGQEHPQFKRQQLKAAILNSYYSILNHFQLTLQFIAFLDPCSPLKGWFRMFGQRASFPG